MYTIIRSIESLVKWVGEKSSYINLLLVLLICADVFMRYVLSFTKTWVLELEWHLFALIFLLGAAYTLQEDQHVRVDVWYADKSPKVKAWINLLGSIIFLIPWCLILIKSSFNYASNSLAMMEGSANPGGLPFRFVIKYCITLCFILLLLQALAIVYRNVMLLLNKPLPKS